VTLPQIFFGTLREHYILLFGAAGALAAVVGFAASWLGAQFGAKRAARLAAESVLAGDRAGLDRNLTALVQAVDSIALEVERLSEGQRFTARLLSERPVLAGAPRQESQARPITPH
jgi:hypothetical protein